jgi:hypothetical protein
MAISTTGEPSEPPAMCDQNNHKWQITQRTSHRKLGKMKLATEAGDHFMGQWLSAFSTPQPPPARQHTRGPAEKNVR